MPGKITNRIIESAELKLTKQKLVFQNKEKGKRAAELVIANKELKFQNKEKEKRAAELVISNKELSFQHEEKGKRAAELVIANKELVFQNKEKEKRAAELVIANKELVFQNKEKEKRADELTIIISDLKKAEKKIIKANHLYYVTSQINQLIVHTSDEQTLFKKICNIAVKVGKFKMAWIGMIDEKTKKINPVGQAGEKQGDLSEIKPISLNNVTEGRGLTGTAFHEGKYNVCNDIENNPEMAPWITEALNHGYYSGIALPIKKSGKVAGVFTVYASEPGFFDKEEISLLDEVSGDISFALDYIEKEEQRIKAEKELREKEFFLRESQKAGSIGSYKLNFLTGKWHSSETLDNIFGIVKNYNRSINGWLEIVHPDDRQMMEEYLHTEVIGKRKSFNKEYRIKKINDKQTKWVCGMGDLKFDDNGNITKMIGTIQDITERKNAEELLFHTQQDYKNLFENMNDGFMVDNISGKVTFVNKRFLEIFGLKEVDLNDFAIEDYVAPGYVATLQDRYNNRIAGEKVPDVFVYEGVRKDGKKIWLEVRVSQVIKNGIITGTQSVISDITKRKNAEDKISESEEIFRRLFNESADPVLLLDDTGFTDCNQAAVSILGYSSCNEVLHKQPWDISPKYQPDGRLSIEKAKEMIAKALWAGYNRFEWIHTKSDGTAFPVEVMLTSIMIRGQQFYYTIWRDIAKRKKAEEKLKESNERYEFVNKATQDMIWEWDYLTKTGRWGDGIIKTFGYSKDKLEYDENWLTEYVHPEDKERILKNIQDRIENKLQNCQNEYRFRCADGSYKYVFDRGYIIFDKNKKPYRMFGAITDITEKKRLERELATQLIYQQKLITETTIQAQEKEKNELGRELHDNINQILAIVKMYLGMAKSGINIEEDLVGKSYDYVDEAIHEIRKLSHSLVAPSLGDMGLKECLLELVEDTNINNNLQLQVIIDESYNEKLTDKNKELMLYRIVQEQLNNILKYAQAREAFITLSTDQDNLILTVTDNGIGFAPSEKSKGIGLKNISSRVEFYSGSMKIISAPGKGCTLEVLIPL